MSNKTIPVPYHYIQQQSFSIPECSDIRIRQFVLPIYLYLGFSQGESKYYYISLKRLLKRACGYSTAAGSRNDNYFELKKALKYLQYTNDIFNIINEDTGEIVDVMNTTPSMELCIELNNFNRMRKEQFVRFTYDEFARLSTIESTTHRWKAIVLYGYIRAQLGYEVTSGKERYMFWNFTSEQVADILRDGFSRHTIDGLFDILKGLELIYWELGYVRILHEKKRDVRRIGKITILNKNDPLEAVQIRFAAIKEKAQKQYLTNMNLSSSSVALERYTLRDDVLFDV